MAKKKKAVAIQEGHNTLFKFAEPLKLEECAQDNIKLDILRKRALAYAPDNKFFWLDVKVWPEMIHEKPDAIIAFTASRTVALSKYVLLNKKYEGFSEKAKDRPESAYGVMMTTGIFPLEYVNKSELMIRKSGIEVINHDLSGRNEQNRESKAYEIVLESLARNCGLMQSYDLECRSAVVYMNRGGLIVANPTIERLDLATTEFKKLNDFIDGHKDEVQEITNLVYAGLSIDELAETPRTIAEKESNVPAMKIGINLKQNSRDILNFATHLHNKTRSKLDKELGDFEMNEYLV